MSTTEWHLDEELARGYAEGRVTSVLAASVEQHLVRCAACRDLLRPTVDSARLRAVWEEVVERVEAPRMGPLERTLNRLGLDEGTSRLVVTTPSLRGAWVTGVVVVLTLALLTAHAERNGVALFMALAPALPVAGVAFAFGPASDPAYEISSATPHSPVHLLAVRTAFVVATTMLPAAVLTPFLPGTGWIALAWLVPALALTGGTLALATRVPPHLAATVLSALWVAVILPGLAHSRDPMLVAHPAVQAVSLLALTVAAAVLLTRRNDLSEILRRNP